ncbi:response regulator [Lysobacter sp. CA199]|uniref:response regulator n=1 Tax=Lysobacter sp. CA199 TaxID=3455608 RepID=UPI003F8D311A
MIHVFIVDDHSLTRAGFRLVIGDAIDIAIVGEAANAADALALIPELNPDVVLCDFHLPDGDGLYVVRQLLALDPFMKIVVVSMLEGGPIPRQLLRAGAKGYVTKASDFALVLQAIRDVAAGGRFLDEALGGEDLLPYSRFDLLSAREQEVVRMIIRGEERRSIADKLGMSASTVGSYRSRIYEKLQIRDREALLRLAKNEGFDGGL